MCIERTEPSECSLPNHAFECVTAISIKCSSSALAQAISEGGTSRSSVSRWALPAEARGVHPHPQPHLHLQPQPQSLSLGLSLSLSRTRTRTLSLTLSLSLTLILTLAGRAWLYFPLLLHVARVNVGCLCDEQR